MSAGLFNAMQWYISSWDCTVKKRGQGVKVVDFGKTGAQSFKSFTENQGKKRRHRRT